MLFRKLTAEFYFAAFKGYYNSNPDEILLNHEESTIYPQHRDILAIELATSVYYIFNNKKFSYRAAFNQDERQKKSAGSLLAGPAIFAIYFQGDSSLIPHDVNPPDFFDGIQVKRSRYAKATLNVGYAYNLIIWERFFITASLILGPGAGYMTLYAESDDIEGRTKADFAFSYTARAAAGYNGKRLYVGVSFVNTSLNSPTPVDKTRYVFNAGNIRFNIAYRIPFNVEVPLL